MELKFRTLNAQEIECRVNQCSEKGVVLLLYKDARCDQSILDETVGPLNWQRHHSRENANCIVSIWDKEKTQWVEKEDTGTKSNTEAEKGLASDSFKRACVNWGIGRELYTAPFIWIPSGKCKITTGRNGNLTCYDRFDVAEIAYTESRTICRLTIFNSKTRAIVFDWVADPPPQSFVPSALPPAADLNAEPVVCECCGEEIHGVYGKTNEFIPASDIMAISQKRFKKNLCAECTALHDKAKKAGAAGGD